MSKLDAVLPAERDRRLSVSVVWQDEARSRPHLDNIEKESPRGA